MISIFKFRIANRFVKDTHFNHSNFFCCCQNNFDIAATILFYLNFDKDFHSNLFISKHLINETWLNTKFSVNKVDFISSETVSGIWVLFIYLFIFIFFVINFASEFSTLTGQRANSIPIEYLVFFLIFDEILLAEDGHR